MAKHAVMMTLLVEQRQRWERADFVRVEDLLRAQPQLAGDADAVLDLICNEIALRRELSPELEASFLRDEYRRRFPAYERELGAEAVFDELLEALAGPPEDKAELPRSTDDRLPAVAGYEVLGELGRGGMGVVYRARHHALDRLVALKVCRDDAWPDGGESFRAEAQALAQLQHPAIVPVYELGTTADGGPFFSMQLIEGASLRQVLGQRSSYRERLLSFLRMFQAIAEGVALAHQRGILHRDLKPGNVMVSQGEQVHVLDWGLGKRLAGRADDADPLALGGGTAEYLSPEQACGGPDIDRRTDVFGLGAILCEILTGQPPYRGTPEQCLEQARKGALEEAQRRLDACGADAELVQLARQCLAPRPEDRPADAAVVAAAVARFLAGLEEKLQAERRLRRLAVALAATVLVLAVTAGSAWVRRTETETAVRLALQNAASLQDDAQAMTLGSPADAQLALLKWQQCDAAVKAAETALALGAAGDAVRQRVAAWRDTATRGIDAARTQLSLLQGLQQAQLARTLRHNRLERDATAAAAQYEQAFRAYGLVIRGADPPAVARRIQDAPAPVRAALIAALDDWSLQAPGDARQLRRIAAQADSDPWRQQLRAALERPDRPALLALSRQARAEGGLPRPHLLLLAEALRHHAESAEAVSLLRHAQALHPDDIGIQWQLGLALTAID